MGVTNRELLVEINAKTDGLKRGMKQAETQTKSFGASIKKVGLLVGAAFSGRELLRFGKDVLMLTSQVEGVRRAFKRIGDNNYLALLRQSVAGTISDLDVMKKSVMGVNLGLPANQLAKYFEFASRRATETGESVDYLVNSIIIGVGRRSTRVIDNLGISADRVKDALGGIGIEAASSFQFATAVGKIFNEELDKMGERTLTGVDRINQMKAAWEGLKVNLGEMIASSLPGSGSGGGISELITETGIFLRLATQVGPIKAFKEASNYTEDMAEQAAVAAKEMENEAAAANNLHDAFQRLIKDKGYEYIEDIPFPLRNFYKDEFGLLREDRSIKVLEKEIEDLSKRYTETATDEGRIYLGKKIKEAKELIENYNREVAMAIGDIESPYEELLPKRMAEIDPFMDIDFSKDFKDIEGIKFDDFYVPGTVGALTEELALLNEELLNTEPKSDVYIEKMKRITELQKILGKTTNTTTTAFAGMASVVSALWADAISGTKSYKEALLDTVAAVISALVAEGVMHIVKGTAEKSSALGPLAIPISAAAGTLAAATFKALIPAYAEGGIVSGSSYNGDNMLARVNSSEMILNSQQQANLFNMLAGGRSVGAGIPHRIELVAKGPDLVGVIDTTNEYYSTVR